MADEVVSLLGDTLTPAPLPDDARQRLDEAWQAARETAGARPADVGARIWLGRRTAYLGRFRDAVAIFTEAIAAHPDDPRLYRHRGHRAITLRRFDDAIADLERASALLAGWPDEIEPDGQPNPRGTPVSSLYFNVWYHLALARYLGGDFGGALRDYRRCFAVSDNPDKLVATAHWLYMTLRRFGHTDEAARVLETIAEDIDVIENRAYERLLRMYQGQLTPDETLGQSVGMAPALHDSTIGYGVANWHYYNGRTETGIDWFRRVYAGSGWAAFGYIAAEAELARSR